MNALFILVLGWLMIAVIMLVTWYFSEQINKAAIVDVVWTFSIGLLALFYALTLSTSEPMRKWLVTGIALLWSLRLGIHLFKRISKEAEDKRYAELKKKWGKKASGKMMIFFQQQGVADSLLSLPILLAIINPTSFPSLFDYLGLFLVAAGVIGDGVADKQLKQFKKNRGNQGKTCRSGLWRYSRHPNYFFEWVFWIGVPCFAIGYPWGLFAWVSPVIMFTILVKYTGIPPAEKQALLSRGEDYRNYQKETNAFFPWLPKNIH
jgi:steroid 5-alpha reductase family enzyme